MTTSTTRARTPQDYARELERLAEQRTRLRKALDAANESAGRFKVALEIANDRLRAAGADEVRL